MSPLPGQLNKPRNRIAVFSILAAVILLGLATRTISGVFPELIVANAGDALWTVAAYLTLAIFRPAWSPLRLGIAAVAISFAVEFSQLLDWSLLSALRGTFTGRLVLGQGFLPIDLVRYISGAAIATTIDHLQIAVLLKNRLGDFDDGSIQ